MEPKIIKSSTDWDTLKKKLHLEEIISCLPCGSYFKNLEGNYIFCNSRLAKEAQLPSPEEIIHRTDYDMPWHIKARAGSMVQLPNAMGGSARYFKLHHHVL